MKVQPGPPALSHQFSWPRSSPRVGERSGERFFALGAGLLLALAGLRALGDLQRHLLLFSLLFAAAWCCYAAAVRLVLRQQGPDSRGILAMIVVVGLAARLLLLGAAPTLSDDLFRYVWEGEVLAHGLSPYALPPNAPALAPWRDAVWSHVNNPGVASPYPPLAQLVGLAEGRLFPHSTFGPKLSATLFDLAAWAVLALLLRRQGLPLRRSLIYGWSPLLPLEFALSGHNDALMLCLLLAALLAGVRRPLAGGALLGLAVLAKATPLLALPLIWRAWGWRAVTVTLGVVAAGYAPFILLGGGAIGSLPLYLASFADNDSLHAILQALVAIAQPDLAPLAAKAITVAIMSAALLALLVVPSLRRRPLWWQVYTALALSLLLASAVHAWYATWLLPFLALRLRSGDRAPWIGPLPSAGWWLFSGLAILPYLTGSAWQLWISMTEYVPLYILLAMPLFQPRSSRRSARSSDSILAWDTFADAATTCLPNWEPRQGDACAAPSAASAEPRLSAE